eukprot:Opistho-1_new@53102
MYAQTYIGTPAYMPPEMLGNEPRFTAKSDIWALGCVLYEMMTLRHAFIGKENNFVWFYGILYGKADPVPSHYSSDLRAVLNSMLEKNPSRRPPARALVKLPMFKHAAERLKPRTIDNEEEMRQKIAMLRATYKLDRPPPIPRNDAVLEQLAIEEKRARSEEGDLQPQQAQPEKGVTRSDKAKLQRAASEDARQQAAAPKTRRQSDGASKASPAERRRTGADTKPQAMAKHANLANPDFKPRVDKESRRSIEEGLRQRNEQMKEHASNMNHIIKNARPRFNKNDFVRRRSEGDASPAAQRASDSEGASPERIAEETAANNDATFRDDDDDDGEAEDAPSEGSSNGDGESGNAPNVRVKALAGVVDDDGAVHSPLREAGKGATGGSTGGSQGVRRRVLKESVLKKMARGGDDKTQRDGERGSTPTSSGTPSGSSSPGSGRDAAADSDGGDGGQESEDASPPAQRKHAAESSDDEIFATRRKTSLGGRRVYAAKTVGEEASSSEDDRRREDGESRKEGGAGDPDGTYKVIVKAKPRRSESDPAGGKTVAGKPRAATTVETPDGKTIRAKPRRASSEGAAADAASGTPEGKVVRGKPRGPSKLPSIGGDEEDVVHSPMRAEGAQPKRVMEKRRSFVAMAASKDRASREANSKGETEERPQKDIAIEFHMMNHEVKNLCNNDKIVLPPIAGDDSLDPSGPKAAVDASEPSASTAAAGAAASPRTPRGGAPGEVVIVAKDKDGNRSSVVAKFSEAEPVQEKPVEQPKREKKSEAWVLNLKNGASRAKDILTEGAQAKE